MEFEGRDVWIGAFVVLAAAAVLGILFAVNRGRILRGHYHVQIQLPSIAGLERGTELVYRGWRAGEVDDIKVVHEPDVHFKLRLSVRSELRIKTGTTVQVKAKGLGGAKYLELEAPARESAGFIEDGEELRAVSEEDLLASAQGVVGDFQRIVGELQKGGTAAGIQAAIGQAKLALADLDAAMRRTNAMLSENRESLKGSLEETRALSGDLRRLMSKKGPVLEQTLDNVNEAAAHLPAIMKNMEELTADLKKHPWKLVRKG